jgi:hypothetical protein
MNTILIVAVVVLLAVVVEERKKIAAATPPPSDVTITIGVAGTETGGDTSDEGITEGLGVASRVASSIPVVGQVLGVFTAIAGVFTQAHAAAEAKQKASIDTALPTFLQQVVAAMQSLGEGTSTEAQTVSLLNQAQLQYYTTVSNFIKMAGKSGQPTTGPTPGGTIGAECNSSCNFLSTGTKPAGYCGPPTCNEGCGVGCMYVQPVTTALIKIVNQGGGSLSIPSYSSSDVTVPAVVITYDPPEPKQPSGLGSSLVTDLKSIF